MQPEKYKQAWKTFQDQIEDLKKRRSEVLLKLSKKLDEQRINTLIGKIKDHE
ncbi:MAG: hypothetical protein K9L31_02385 [Candidatus Pacebacteria bacterium]|nr:hypothetical protein [Candidatus Paceibacterota bacterium]